MRNWHCWFGHRWRTLSVHYIDQNKHLQVRWLVIEECRHCGKITTEMHP